MTLLITGLALFLVSLIPPAPLGVSGSQGTLFDSLVLDSGLYTPHIGLQVTVEAEDMMRLYMISFNETYIAEWIIDRYPLLGNQVIVIPSEGSQGGQVIYYPLSAISLNASMVEEFLDAHPGSVLWSGETADGKISLEYEPRKVVQATVILLNLNEVPTPFEAEWERISLIASRERLIMPTQILFLLGGVFIIPWIIQLRKQL